MRQAHEPFFSRASASPRDRCPTWLSPPNRGRTRREMASLSSVVAPTPSDRPKQTEERAGPLRSGQEPIYSFDWPEHRLTHTLPRRGASHAERWGTSLSRIGYTSRRRRAPSCATWPSTTEKPWLDAHRADYERWWLAPARAFVRGHRSGAGEAGARHPRPSRSRTARSCASTVTCASAPTSGRTRTTSTSRSGRGRSVARGGKRRSSRRLHAEETVRVGVGAHGSTRSELQGVPRRPS